MFFLIENCTFKNIFSDGEISLILFDVLYLYSIILLLLKNIFLINIYSTKNCYISVESLSLIKNIDITLINH